MFACVTSKDRGRCYYRIRIHPLYALVSYAKQNGPLGPVSLDDCHGVVDVAARVLRIYGLPNSFGSAGHRTLSKRSGQCRGCHLRWRRVLLFISPTYRPDGVALSRLSSNACRRFQDFWNIYVARFLLRGDFELCFFRTGRGSVVSGGPAHLWNSRGRSQWMDMGLFPKRNHPSI